MALTTSTSAQAQQVRHRSSTPLRRQTPSAKKTPTVSLVVPTLNEAKNLPIVFARIPKCVTEVIVVDGRSTDGTIDVAKSLRPDVKIVLDERKGKGYALASGFAAATQDIIVMIDADGSMAPEEVELFVEALVNGSDFVKGSRYMPGGGSEDLTFIRSAGNKALTIAVNILFGADYTDLCYGYNGFWRDVLPGIEFDCGGFEVETLMNIRAQRAGLNVSEVPSYETDRIFGVSNLNAWKDGWRIGRTLIAERFRRHPKFVRPQGR